MAFAKFEENRFRIDGKIAENHAILVNLTASLPSFHIIVFYTLIRKFFRTYFIAQCNATLQVKST